MKHLHALSRRGVLQQGAFLLGASMARQMFAEDKDVRIEQPNAGSAGVVWRPLLEKTIAQRAPALHAEWIGGDPGQSQVQLLAGAIQTGFFGPIGAAQATLKGRNVVLYAPGLLNHASWVVRGDSSVRTLQELKGKRIATQPETTETYRQARLAASLSGLDFRHDFQFIFGPPLANLALFDRGDVDAVLTIEPIVTKLIAGGAREVLRVRDQWQHGTGESQPLCLGGQGATREWLDANRGTAELLSQLYGGVNKQIRQRPALLADMHALLGIATPDRGTLDLLAKRMSPIYGDWSPEVMKNANHVVDMAVSKGILDAKPTQSICEIV